MTTMFGRVGCVAPDSGEPQQAAAPSTARWHKERRMEDGKRNMVAKRGGVRAGRPNAGRDAPERLEGRRNLRG